MSQSKITPKCFIEKIRDPKGIIGEYFEYSSMQMDTWEVFHCTFTDTSPDTFVTAKAAGSEFQRLCLESIGGIKDVFKFKTVSNL